MKKSIVEDIQYEPGTIYRPLAPRRPAEWARRIVYTLMACSLLFVLFALNSCASPQDNARTLLDRIEFQGEEYGSFEVEGNIDLSSVPFVSATVHVKLEKFKDKPNQIEEVNP